MRTLRIFLLLALGAFSFTLAAQTPWPAELILTPEKSDFVKTSTYPEVVQFLKSLEAKSDYMSLFSMGISPEGKDIPVAVLANPKIRTPEEAKASGKMVVYIQGNIHAGEVEGKEVVMMLMRDILLGDKKHLLDNQILLLAPIYNTDSNDKMAAGRRPSQEDSPLEVGIRENSQGLDLNRDGVKQEAPETQALFTGVINPWDPQVFVDLHTTNGTWHAYSLTWAPSYHYAGEEITHHYTKNIMLKAISHTVKEKYGLAFGPYGNYDVNDGWPLKNFYTYNHHPRYLVNQFSLRNRMAILSESFAHERFYQRIHATYAFVSEILAYTDAHAKDIVATNQQAENNAIKLVKEQGGKVTKGVRFKMVSREKLNNFITYDYVLTQEADGTKKWYRTGKISSYDSVNYFGDFEATKKSTLPNGYIIPAAFANIAEHLQKMGVKVEKLAKTETFSGEAFTVSKLEKSTRRFEGHFMATAQGTFAPATRKFKKGDYRVDLAQPLANLIFYVLEPESDDGLVSWNFFDNYFSAHEINNKPVEYPVFKYFR